VQFGFSWSGPAELAKAAHAVGEAQVWRISVKTKLLLLAGPVALLFGLGYANLAWGQWYLLWFALLLAAFALNSNWFLQAQQNFAAGVGFTGLGVAVSALMLCANEFDGAWVVSLLVMPQVCLGLGSWWVARQACAGVTAVDANWQSSLGVLRKDAPLVASQLLLLASTTLGTVVVGALADADTTTAYAATEKLFNLGATVLVGLYMAVYPRFAAWFYSDRAVYWKETKQLLLAALLAGVGLVVLLNAVGPWLMAVYLPAHLAQKVVSVLLPFALWLGMCISQHMLTSYLVLAERNSQVLWVNACVLTVTVLVGYAFAHNNPVAWVYGMVAGQVLALVLLLQLYLKDRPADL
jgi:O-antigen/teichoic acid export membrane protein